MTRYDVGGRIVPDLMLDAHNQISPQKVSTHDSVSTALTRALWEGRETSPSLLLHIGPENHLFTQEPAKQRAPIIPLTHKQNFSKSIKEKRRQSGFSCAVRWDEGEMGWEQGKALSLTGYAVGSTVLNGL